MKVLKEGKWKMKWEMEMVCTDSSCGATLLVEEADVTAVDYGNGYRTTCPVCGSFISVPDKSLPRRIKNPLDMKRKYSSSSGWD